jgi:hypothetical protein
MTAGHVEGQKHLAPRDLFKIQMINPKKEISDNYVCIDPSQGNKLFDYYNGSLNETTTTKGGAQSTKEVEEFEEHLLFCHACQEKFMQLENMFNTLREEMESSCLDMFDTVSADN